MKTINNYFFNFFKLLSYTNKKEKISLFFAICAMVVTSFLEVLSIGTLIPFVTVILSPDKLINNNFINLYPYKDYNLQLIFTFIFILTIILSTLFRVFVLHLTIKLSKVIPLQFSKKIYSKILSSEYQKIKEKNSAESISIITDKMDAISAVLFTFLNAFSSIIICIGILSLLFFIDPLITTYAIIIATLIYLLIAFFAKSRLKENSKILSNSSILRIKHVKETFGAFKQIILYDTRELFQKIFFRYDSDYKFAQYKSQFLNSAPRFFVEAFGIIFISILIYFLYAILAYDTVYIITLIGTIAFTSQKLLPLLNNIYSCYGIITNYSAFIYEISNNLFENKKTDNLVYLQKNIAEFKFEKSIFLKEISFKYNRGNKILIKSFNLEIAKGEKIAIVGETGCGKSSLLDILMGLLRPTSGKVEIDREELNSKNISEWQKKIAHVPQEIFLFDNSILKNIAFNLNESEINLSQIIECAKNAEIHDFIETLPEKYQTIIGENGLLISGGQRQRIGIARALYKNRDILTLDEATSALDFETEKKILNNLTQNNKTIIQITHRINDAITYDKIVKL